MNEIIKLVIHYSKYIYYLVVILLLVIGVIFNKKPITDNINDILVYIDEVLPDLILSAEKIPELSQKGTDKLALVVSSCVKLVKTKFKVKVDSSLQNRIVGRVEAYLSTPQKKEV